MPSLELVWNLIARDGASPAFTRVGASAEGASRSVGGLLKTMGAFAVGAAVVESIKSASDFAAKMQLIQTQAGAAASEVRKMSPAILSLAGQVAQAPEQLATSLYHVESTGLRGAKALEAVKIAAEGARVGHADLEQTTNALTATIASGMLPATESYAQAMGQLNTIVGSGDMKMEDLNDALSTGLLVTVKQFGVNINDVGAALADFGDNNIRGADAATKLRMAVQAIAKPGVGAADALGKIGLTVEQMQSDLSHGGLNKALTDLHTHLVNSGIDASQWGQLMTDAFTKKAGSGVITLIGTFDRFEQKFKEVSKGADSFGAAWTATTKTAAFQFASLKDTVDQLGIQLGNVLLPPLNGFAHILTVVVTPVGKLLALFQELPGPVKDFAYALGGLKLASMIGLLGGLRGAVGGVTAAYGESAAAATAAATAARVSATQQAALWGETTGAAALGVAEQSALWGELAGAEEVSVSRMAIAAGMAQKAMSGLGAAGSKAFSAIGGGWGIAFGAAIVLLPQLIDGFKLLTGNVIDASQATQTFTQALQQTNGVIDATIGKTAQQLIQQNDLIPLFQKAGVSAKDAVAGIEGNAAAQHRVNQAIQDYITYSAKGQGSHSKDATAAAKSRDAYNQLVGAFGTATQSAKYFGDQADKTGKATGKTGDAAKTAAKSLALFGSTAGMTADEIKNAQKAIQDQQKALEQDAASFVDPLKTYQDMAQAMAQKVADSTKDAKDSWSDYVSNVKIDLADYAKSLEKQITDQQNWQKNLVTIAQRAGVGVAQQFADMGVQGAGLTAQMASATGATFDRMAKDMTAKAALAGSGTAQALQEGMAVAAAKAADGAAATVQGVAKQLDLGVDEVRRIAAQYGVSLAEGINPVLAALGKPHVIMRLGVPQGFSDGGFTGAGGKNEPKGVVHGGEFVFTKEQTANAGVPTMYALATMLSGFSGGGYVSPSDVPNPPSLAPYRPPISTAGSAAMGTEHDAVTQWLAAHMFGGGNTSIPGGRSAVAAAVQAIAATYGWGSGAEWQALVSVINRESGFNPNAANPTSSARGLFQKMTSIHGPVESTVPGQTYWGLNYIRSAYGDPINAWRHEMSAGWYDGGGYLPPGLTLAMNGTGKPERVRTAEQESALSGGLKGLRISGRLEIGGDGLATLVDGRIDAAFGSIHDTIHYAGG